MVGLIVGVVLFAMSFYYITQASVERTADTTRAGDANADARATALADVLVSSGSGWYDATPCVESGSIRVLDATSFDPDRVATVVDGEVEGRFGLGEEVCLRGSQDSRSRNNLSYQKLYSLFEAGNEADPANDRVDYEEARRSLGLAEGEDFHLRAWPIMGSIHQLLDRGFKDPVIRPLYIGDYEDAAELVDEEVEHTYSIVDSSDRITVRLTITNSGTEASIFAALFELPLDKNTVGFTLHTPLLTSGQSHTIEFTVRKSSDWKWDRDDEKWITFEIQDRDGAVGSGVISLAGVDMTQLLKQTNVFVEANEMYWVKGATGVEFQLTYMAFEGDGTKKKFSDWKLLTTDPLGLPMTPVALSSAAFSGTAEQVGALEGSYKGEVRNALLTATWNLDYVNVVGSDSVVHSLTTGPAQDMGPNPAVAIEAAYLDVVARDFENGVFSSDYDTAAVPYVTEGDIYPDLKSVMDNALVDALADEDGTPVYDYNVVVVGSDVDHNAMTSAAAKNTIRDWVLGGGTLLVFGSDDQSVQWLRPLFQTSLVTANGPLETPDEAHPILQVPNQLDYPAYEYETEWTFGADAEESFTKVVSTSGGSVLAVSDAGSFGAGRVILSSWRPYTLTPDQSVLCPSPLTSPSQCQPLFLIHNALTSSYRYLFLDFGPPIPTDSNVGSTLRVVSVYHPELRELVPMHLQVFVFD